MCTPGYQEHHNRLMPLFIFERDVEIVGGEFEAEKEGGFLMSARAQSSVAYLLENGGSAAKMLHRLTEG